ncbi:MAG: HlyC/CorC family transporter [Clostridiaceae bacterium]|jgi:CBS domain containing-hemolysin-like protein|nr:HlyC/CorC family transporter [Clostridiaceae bacterium]
MPIFADILSAGLPLFRFAMLFAGSLWVNLVWPLLFLVATTLLTAFMKSVRFLPQPCDDLPNRPRVPLSLAKKMETSEIVERETRTAIFLNMAAFLIASTRAGLPSFIVLIGAPEEPVRGWISFGWYALSILAVLVIGFVVPLRAGGRRRETFACAVWPAISFLLFLVRPIDRLIFVTASGIMKLFRLKDVKDRSQILTEEELLNILGNDSGESDFEADNIEYIENLFQFDDKVASDVMTHRIEIDALPIDTDYETTISFIRETRHTRFPIFRGTVDNIVGILHVKDLLFVEQDDSFSLEKMMREPWFTPESRNTRQLLREMQKEHVQMAIVIDEYGGTAGMITIEDLVEQIVGNIEDEYDDDEQEMIRVAPDTWVVAGSYPIDRLARETGVFFGEDEFDSTAGFVIERLDRIPEENEHASITFGSLTFDVMSVIDNRIAWLRVTRTSDEKNVEGYDND